MAQLQQFWQPKPGLLPFLSACFLPQMDFLSALLLFLGAAPRVAFYWADIWRGVLAGSGCPLGRPLRFYSCSFRLFASCSATRSRFAAFAITLSHPCDFAKWGLVFLLFAFYKPTEATFYGERPFHLNSNGWSSSHKKVVRQSNN